MESAVLGQHSQFHLARPDPVEARHVQDAGCDSRFIKPTGQLVCVARTHTHTHREYTYRGISIHRHKHNSILYMN